MPWSWKMKTFKEKIEIHPSKHVPGKHSQNSKAVPCANYVNIARRKRVKTAFCANKMFAYGNE